MASHRGVAKKWGEESDSNVFISKDESSTGMISCHDFFTSSC